MVKFGADRGAGVFIRAIVEGALPLEDCFSIASDLPIGIAEMVEDGKYIAAARSLLGADQWSTFKQHHRMGDVEPFFDALGEAVGGNPTS